MDNNPPLIDTIFKLPRLTVLEKYVGIDRCEDKDGDMLCQLHSRKGGCQIWEEEGAAIWKEFFNRLDLAEQEINQ